MTWKATWQLPLGRLRMIGLVEGVSFILLVGVAMPLKYLMNLPMAVSVVGMVHGLLFLWLCFALLDTVFGKGWPFRHGALVFGAALIPFGPFLIDRWLLAQQQVFGGKPSEDPLTPQNEGRPGQ